MDSTLGSSRRDNIDSDPPGFFWTPLYHHTRLTPATHTLVLSVSVSSLSFICKNCILQVTPFILYLLSQPCHYRLEPHSFNRRRFPGLIHTPSKYPLSVFWTPKLEPANLLFSAIAFRIRIPSPGFSWNLFGCTTLTHFVSFGFVLFALYPSLSLVFRIRIYPSSFGQLHLPTSSRHHHPIPLDHLYVETRGTHPPSSTTFPPSPLISVSHPLCAWCFLYH